MSPIASGARLAIPVSKQDHIRGPEKAPITLVEYGDFECPHCGQAHVVLETLEEQVGDLFSFVFRHFPFATAHPHAQHAAEAAEAAGSQDRFWEMHDILFENQHALDDESLLRYAVALDLDPNRFVSELARHIHAGRVREDVLSGARSGVNGTPTFFINNFRHDGGYDLDSLLDAIESAMETKG